MTANTREESESRRPSTQAATANIPPFGLRMQSVLKAELESVAVASGRSLNAEIVDRLRQSFEPMVELDPGTLEAVERYAERHSFSTAEALSILVLAGLKEADSKIVYLQMRPGVSMAEFTQQIQGEAARNPHAEVHLARPRGEQRAVGAEIQTFTGGTVRVAQRITMG